MRAWYQILSHSKYAATITVKNLKQGYSGGIKLKDLYFTDKVFAFSFKEGVVQGARGVEPL